MKYHRMLSPLEIVLRISNTTISGFVIFYLSTFFLTPPINPSQWLLPNYIDSQALSELQPIVAVFTQMGIDVFAPAALVSAVAYLAGIRIKEGANFVLQVYPAVVTTTYFICLMVVWSGSEGSGWYLFFAMPVIFILMAAGIYLALSDIRTNWTTKRLQPPFYPSSPSVVLIPFIPLLLITLVLLLQPTKPFLQTQARSTSFLNECKTVGVKIYAKPSTQAHSIAFDPINGHRFPYSRLQVDEKGRPSTSGGFVHPGTEEFAKSLSIERYELRTADTYGKKFADGRTTYFRVSDGMPSVEVPNFSPQVFVRYAVDKPEELSRAYIGQRAIRYSVKAIETQSETLLAEFSYVVDIMNKRACGTNVGNVISNEAFLFDALAKPK